MQPESAKEVVELAGSHLSLGRNLVVSWANSYLGPAEGARSEDDLRRLWRALVDEFGPDSVPAAPALAAEPPAPSRQDPVAITQQDQAQDPDPPRPEEPQVDTADTVDEPAEPEMAGPQGDGLDLNELMDATSHTDQVVELLEEAFPGAEIEAPSTARADQ